MLLWLQHLLLLHSLGLLLLLTFHLLLLHQLLLLMMLLLHHSLTHHRTLLLLMHQHLLLIHLHLRSHHGSHHMLVVLMVPVSGAAAAHHCLLAIVLVRAGAKGIFFGVRFGSSGPHGLHATLFVSLLVKVVDARAGSRFQVGHASNGIGATHHVLETIECRRRRCLCRGRGCCGHCRRQGPRHDVHVGYHGLLPGVLPLGGRGLLQGIFPRSAPFPFGRIRVPVQKEILGAGI